MRIFYSAANRVGSALQLQRIVENLQGEHELFLAGYYKNSQYTKTLNCTLDVFNQNLCPIASKERKDLYKTFGYTKPAIPPLNINYTLALLEDVRKFQPDLVISDAEEISAHIATALNAPLWYCSPTFMYIGIKWEYDNKRYMSRLWQYFQYLKKLPPANKYLIYSPLGFIKNKPQLTREYSWVYPYHYASNPSSSNNILAILHEQERINSLSKWFRWIKPRPVLFNISDYEDQLNNCNTILTSGDSSIIADAIYNNKKICIIPNVKETEDTINALALKKYKVGKDLGQVELMGKYTLDELQDTFDSLKIEYELNKNPIYLHQHIDAFKRVH